MCSTCGCVGDDGVRLEGDTLHDHHHHSDQGHHHEPLRAHAPGLSHGRMVQIERDILSHNNAHADENRLWFTQRGIFALNLVSSPGSGKTTLLTRTIERLRGRVEVSVIEGDQQTSHDAERIRATGAKAVQINTGRGCHLDAHMVQQALSRLDPQSDSVVMIENVGNLVCPAAFDLGEAHKVVVLSVTEGEDKPLKYSGMFHAASVMLLNKIDLLPYVSFEVGRCVEYACRVNPRIRIIEISATRGDGMDEWLDWVATGARSARRGVLAGLKQRIANAQSWVAAQRA
jgi:hydrogenase nickel incorporation protein HypB